jgi:hypothetical protein
VVVESRRDNQGDFEALAFVITDELIAQLPLAGVHLDADSVGEIAQMVADAVLDAFNISQRVG